MIADLLTTRIREYAPANALEQENVLQELMQHYVLASLSREGLFSEAMFHGGTCLRIVYGMSRFSEDLDFLLKAPDPAFRWGRFLDRVRRDCVEEGIEFEVQDRSKANSAVQKAFLKTDSIGKILILELPFERHRTKKVSIKLEIDTNPPVGSDFKTSYITFPVISPITTQALESGFATKAHALLCRKYVKGRDWYDFVWYISRKTRINLLLLRNALFQQGPWAGQPLEMNINWFIDAMNDTIKTIDWQAARLDVQRFIPQREQEGIASWNTDFFLYQLALLRDYLPGKR